MRSLCSMIDIAVASISSQIVYSDTVYSNLLIVSISDCQEQASVFVISSPIFVAASHHVVLFFHKRSVGVIEQVASIWCAMHEITRMVQLSIVVVRSPHAVF